jgi:hypothetical protein
VRRKEEGGDNMVTKKDVIVGVLATFCFTALLFTVLIGIGANYDPWLDTNHDGKIDIKDIAAVAKAFGTAGDPTVNVTVTNPDHVQPLPYLYIYSAPLIVCTSAPQHPSPEGVGPGTYETCVFIHNPSALSTVYVGKKFVFVQTPWNESLPSLIIWPINMTLGPDAAMTVTSQEILYYASMFSTVLTYSPVEGYVCIISTSPYLDVNAYYTVSGMSGNSTSIDSQIISPEPFMPLPLTGFP